jgi:hypothetical protein
MREAGQVTKCLWVSYHKTTDGPNKSLDASGGSVFRIMLGPAMLE